MTHASLVLVRPCIEIKTVKGDALSSDRNDNHVGADFPVEAILVHAEIGRCVPESNKSRSSVSGRLGQGVRHAAMMRAE